MQGLAAYGKFGTMEGLAAVQNDSLGVLQAGRSRGY
jgi:hypothetical protein